MNGSFLAAEKALAESPAAAFEEGPSGQEGSQMGAPGGLTALWPVCPGSRSLDTGGGEGAALKGAAGSVRVELHTREREAGSLLQLTCP